MTAGENKDLKFIAKTFHLNDMKHPTLIIFCVFSSLLLLTSLRAAAQDGLPNADFTPLRMMGQAEVIEVIGPLTLMLNDGRIARLSGIDAPDNNPEDAGQWAVTARNILRDMYLGKRVTVYQTKQKGRGRLNRMGHHMMHIERQSDKAWAQGSLLKLGLVRVRSTQRMPEMTDQMYALEQAARLETLGIWSEDSYRIHTPDTITDEDLRRFQIVEGKVQSVALKQNRIYMNFGANWRDDFTVSIAPSDKRLFSKAGLDPMNWGGKTMRVRGLMKPVNGYYIEVDHPQAIEILNKRQSALPIVNNTPNSKARSLAIQPSSP